MTDQRDERTFRALPPSQGRAFALTWWGRAWLTALEHGAMDLKQVKQGRGLARAGAVGAVSVRPGRITAVVRDRDGTRHRADVLLQELSGDQWDRFLDMAAERAGHVAALLDHEMPTHLVEDAAAAGVELLPGLGDLEPECDCGAWDHCGHTAALCYQMARLLDEDPFVLLLMRGRVERLLLDELQARSAPPSGVPASPETPVEGVDAAEAYAAGDILPPLPGPPSVPERSGPPPSLDTDTRPAPGVDAAALRFLATQAAQEALRLLGEAVTPGHERQGLATGLSTSQDAVRLAAGDPSEEIATRLAQGTGRDRTGLGLAARAWRNGGAAALSVLEDDEWSADATTLARARTALESAWDEDERPELRAAGNRWTVDGTPAQLRLGRDGRWWPYREEGGRWAPAGGPSTDPAAALAQALEDEERAPL
ncbi:SWF or SNF family helicase [Streptomyces sp. NPDC059786]|uniref:SWF or SNF family helicase n=1 Tax=Streptomyces sp. NPDC059786 TaxID=3346946 RepID=UPI00365F2189